MKYGLLILGLSIILSCQTKETQETGDNLIERNTNNDRLEYIMSYRNRGALDTIFMDIVERQTTDSFHIIKYRVHSDQGDESPLEQTYRLPVNIGSISSEHLELVKETNMTFESKDYKILKYQLNVNNMEDEESLLFYTSDFGIILFHWGTHRNSQRLIHTGDKQKDKTVYFLNDKIENDFDLIKTWD